MKELIDIVKAYDRAVLANKKTALATVVDVKGSSYRRPGARMLVTEDGVLTGAISGGCLEGDALRKAQVAIHQQQNKLVVYDTTDEDDLKFGVQLGCNGIVSILFEPIAPHQLHHPINLLRQVCSSRKEALLITVFGHRTADLHPGTVGYIQGDKSVWLTERVDFKIEACSALLHSSSAVKQFGDCTALYQFVPPATQLIVAGAGNDAQPLVEMGALLGWEIVVADGRPTHATTQRFARANKVIVGKPNEVLRQIELDEHTACVLMTHNYNYDIGMIELLNRVKTGYIGVLGPKTKLDRMLVELQDKGIILGEEFLNRVHGPVGLDIGAEAAGEIAVSIIAEIKAFQTDRTGASLRLRQGPIYERS